MATYKKLNQTSNESEEDWLVTYSDAVTLILCFFVLLISISEPNKEKFEQVKEQLSEQLQEEISKPFEELRQDIQAMISEQMLDETVSVEETERGIIIEISSSSFFESGKAQFKAASVPILLDISAILQDFDYEDYLIEVEGHTDDVPLKGSGQFPSNWELSGARASGVVRFFIEEGLEKDRMRAKAFADTQPKVPNIDENSNPIEENREINRRIAIKIERN
jgi:chemotaxis protein MotB